MHQSVKSGAGFWHVLTNIGLFKANSQEVKIILLSSGVGADDHARNAQVSDTQAQIQQLK